MKKLINPFTYYSGGTTLAIGVAGMALMVWIAQATGQTFRGLTSIGIGESSWLQLAGQLLAGWALFSALLYAAARIFSPSQIRLIDIVGNQAMARLPYLVLLLFELLYSTPQLLHDAEEIQQLNFAEMTSYTPPIGLVLSGVVGIVVLVWFFAWSWMGFSIAANLRGKRAAAIYIGCYLLAEGLMTAGAHLLK